MVEGRDCGKPNSEGHRRREDKKKKKLLSSSLRKSAGPSSLESRVTTQMLSIHPAPTAREIYGRLGLLRRRRQEGGEKKEEKKAVREEEEEEGEREPGKKSDGTEALRGGPWHSARTAAWLQEGRAPQAATVWRLSTTDEDRRIQSFFLSLPL